jgi:hypothetical protein
MDAEQTGPGLGQVLGVLRRLAATETSLALAADMANTYGRQFVTERQTSYRTPSRSVVSPNLPI